VTLIFAFIFATHQIDELLCAIDFIHFHKRVIYKRFRVCDLLSIIMALALILPYILLNKPWFVNDFLSILILHSLLKLLKLTSLKNGVFFFVPCLIIDMISSTILTLSVGRVN
jgi:hypothetical protein